MEVKVGLDSKGNYHRVDSGETKPFDPKCDSCGKELTPGDWPYCPHGKKGAYTWMWGVR